MDKNKLSTDTLTFSDIENKAEYSASSTGVNLDTRKTAEAKDAGLTPAIGTKATGDADSTTKSAIAEGTIEVRIGNTDLSNLSRDTANSLNALGKIFDKKTVAEQQELAKVFGKVAYKLVGELSAKKQVEGSVAKELADKFEKTAQEARNNGDTETAELNEKLAQQYRGIEQDLASWKEGGANKIALHSLVGGLMADLGGGSFVSGATGAAVNEAVAGELSKIKDTATRQWASAVIGAAASKAIDGDVQTAASTAASGTANNNLWDMTKGFVAGTAEGLIGDVQDTLNWITSPGEQLKQLGEVAQTIWEIGKTPGGFAALFDAMGAEAKDRYEAIMSIPDENERDHELGLLAGSGIYFALSTGAAPEKLGAKFPGLASKLEKLKFIKQTETIVKGERILEQVKSYEQARNVALNIVGELGADSTPYIGRLGTGEGKIVGRQSADGKVRWRLDYDPEKGPHINVEDFRNGKGENAVKICIPFEGDVSTVESMLEHLNR